MYIRFVKIQNIVFSDLSCQQGSIEILATIQNSNKTDICLHNNVPFLPNSYYHERFSKV